MRVSQERDREHEGASRFDGSPHRDGPGETSGRFLGIGSKEQRRGVGSGSVSSRLRSAMRSQREAQAVPKRATLQPAASEA